MVPHLVTALNGPLLELEKKILTATPAIERWFRLEWQEHTPPFYCSVDLRNAGFKLAPVATDLFPGGFNNLTPEMLPLAVQAAMAAIEKICPEARNLLLVPGPQVRDTFYLQNLQRLVRVFNQAGLNVRMGSLDADITGPTPLALPDGSELLLEPLLRTRGRLGLKDFDPCTILLNNDLAALREHRVDEPRVHAEQLGEFLRHFLVALEVMGLPAHRPAGMQRRQQVQIGRASCRERVYSSV